MLHIASTADARFAPDCAVMLASLVATNPPDALTVHFLADGALPESDLNGLQSIVTEAGGSFDVLRIDERRVADLNRSERFPIDVWYRVLLAELLPELSRVLYLDADTLIVGSLAPLWEIDLRGCLLGAVTNPLLASMVPRVQKLGLPDGASYFNSGVLLIDLTGWREESIGQAVLEFARDHPMVWPDQDSLNGVLHARRMHLHPRWNAMPGLWELPQRYVPHTPAETREATTAPAVVHFVGPYKPWHYRSRHPYRSEYLTYLEGTPWQGRSIEGRTAWHAVLRPLPSLWSLRIELALLGAAEQVRATRQRLRIRTRAAAARRRWRIGRRPE